MMSDGGGMIMPMPDPGNGAIMPTSDGSEAFVTYGRGVLKVFNVAKNFGFISPIFRSEDSEGPPLNLDNSDGLWFFGNHRLPARAVPGVELTFEIWENAQRKAQARNVQVAAEPTLAARPEDRIQEFQKERAPRRHPNEPKVIYPSVYVSDIPVEYTEVTIRELHRQLGLNPETIMGLKFLPFTEVSLGLSADGAKQAQVAPVTGAVILRYQNDEAANAAVERLKGHPIRTSKGVTKYLGAKHAAPAKWVLQRRQEQEDEKRQTSPRGESLMQKVRGAVSGVSMAGFGVIKSAEWGEVMWRQYELPTNLRTVQFVDSAKFKKEVEKRDDYRRLKEMEGKEVEAELYKLGDGQIRAWHVRVVQPGGGDTPLMLEDGSGATGSTARAPHFGPPGGDFNAAFDPSAPPLPREEDGAFGFPGGDVPQSMLGQPRPQGEGPPGVPMMQPFPPGMAPPQGPPGMAGPPMG